MIAASATYVGVLLFVLGTALFLRGFRGRPEWTHPACAKCRYDLRGLDPDQHKECPECGNNLAKPGSVRFGRARRSYRVMVLGVLLALSPLYMVVGRHVQATVMTRLAQQRSTHAVIADLATDVNNPQTWNELLNRLYEDRLSDDDIAAAIDFLISHLEAVGGAGNQPLMTPRQFLSVVHSEERLSRPQFERLCRAYYLSGPEVKMPARIRSGEQFSFEVGGWHWDLDGVTTLYALREVTFEGKALEPGSSRMPFHRHGGMSARGRGAALSGSGGWGMKGNLTLDAEPGDHEFVFAIDFGVAEDFLGSFGPSGQGPRESWPETIFVDSREVRVPFTVLAPGESPIALVAPARHRDAVVSSLRVSGLRFGFEDGRQSAELIINPAPSPPVPLSFKVFVRAGTFEREIGSLTSRDSRRGHSGMRLSLPGFPDVSSVDVIFRPDPKAVEGRADWSEIWGEEIVIENVRVIRPAPQREMTRRAMRAALHVDAVNPGVRRDGRTHTPSILMNSIATPMPARFQVLIRSGEYEHEIATLDAGPHGSTKRSGHPAIGLPEDVETVTVIFRPNLNEKELRERMAYWDEEIIFENVPVFRTRSPDEE